MPYDYAQRLHDELSKVCPIISSSLNGYEPTPTATADQLSAANAVLAAFVATDVAHEAWLANRNPDRRDLLADAQQALADNATFLALGSPNNAQTLAQVRSLTRQVNRLIRRLIQL